MVCSGAEKPNSHQAGTHEELWILGPVTRCTVHQGNLERWSVVSSTSYLKKTNKNPKMLEEQGERRMEGWICMGRNANWNKMYTRHQNVDRFRRHTVSINYWRQPFCLFESSHCFLNWTTWCFAKSCLSEHTMELMCWSIQKPSLCLSYAIPFCHLHCTGREAGISRTQFCYIQEDNVVKRVWVAPECVIHFKSMGSGLAAGSSCIEGGQLYIWLIHGKNSLHYMRE